jgi:DNA-directed RNA polymerase specialized sigma24 family protein
MDDLLTQTGFDKLLALLDADREHAGAKYESLRVRLIKLFEWRNCETPEELADTAFDRVMRKIEAGERIQNVEAYAVTVAQFVVKEDGRSHARLARSIEDNPRIEELLVADVPVPPDEMDEARLTCLDRCLAQFPDGQRRLITAYYDTDERTMIEARKRLAASEGISPNSLRIRVCRLKAKLEECARDCCREFRPTI